MVVVSEEDVPASYVTSPAGLKSLVLMPFRPMAVPADNVVSLRIDNITSNWETYTVSFDAKMAGPMVS
jgi:hypothetical protein